MESASPPSLSSEQVLHGDIPHILEEIFLHLDYECLKTCFEVCSDWRKILKSVSFQKKAKVVFATEISMDQEKLVKASYDGNTEMILKLLSTDFFDGLKVYVHNSDTFPEVGQRGFIINKGTVNYVALKAYITESSVDTRRYSNLTRGCNFADERQLRYYKNYTRANCELESKIDAFQENCGCKPYYFPGDLVICDREGMQCIHRNQSNFTVIGT